jgi:hypothetical protein
MPPKAAIDNLGRDLIVVSEAAKRRAAWIGRLLMMGRVCGLLLSWCRPGCMRGS